MLNFPVPYANELIYSYFGRQQFFKPTHGDSWNEGNGIIRRARFEFRA